MRAIVSCAKCVGPPRKEGYSGSFQAEAEAPTLAELGEVLTSLLAACHATPPHCPHTLKVEFEDAPDHVVRLERELIVRCLSAKCEAAEKELRSVVPRELVGALTLLFHTSHEGHPMEISYDGRSWRSPV